MKIKADTTASEIRNGILELTNAANIQWLFLDLQGLFLKIVSCGTYHP